MGESLHKVSYKVQQFRESLSSSLQDTEDDRDQYLGMVSIGRPEMQGAYKKQGSLFENSSTSSNTRLWFFSNAACYNQRFIGYTPPLVVRF